jgi:hypothetical protein
MLEIDGVAREPAAETQIVFNTCMCPSLKATSVSPLPEWKIMRDDAKLKFKD